MSRLIVAQLFVLHVDRYFLQGCILVIGPVRGNYEISPEGQVPIPADTVTIAEVAKSAGYATATFGKWGMEFFDSEGSPFK